jgi:hypothetical protein
MMKFQNFENMIQVFANEYLVPKSVILVIGPGKFVPFFKNVFEFLNSEVIFLDTTFYQGINVTSELNVLPFEDRSFDFVISLKKCEDLFRICKHEVLLKEEIINAKENYLLCDAIYSVL